MKLSDQETGYYVGIAYHSKMVHDFVEEFQERGLDPYHIVEAVLFSCAKLQMECMQLLKDSEYEAKDDSHSENP